MAMKYCMTYAALYAYLGEKMIGQVMSGDYDVIRDTGSGQKVKRQKLNGCLVNGHFVKSKK